MTISKVSWLKLWWWAKKLYISYLLAKWSWKCASLFFEGKHLRCLHRVLTARAPMSQALVMCAHQLTQAHANQRTSQQYSSNYSPEVETEQPFKRKRKENDLDGKVLCVFWWDRHCRVAHRQNCVVRKFTHAHIAILASSYSDDAIAIELKKKKNPYQISQISFGQIP